MAAEGEIDSCDHKRDHKAPFLYECGVMLLQKSTNLEAQKGNFLRSGHHKKMLLMSVFINNLNNSTTFLFLFFVFINKILTDIGKRPYRQC